MNNVIQINENVNCNYCNKEFSCEQSLKRHLDGCRAKLLCNSGDRIDEIVAKRVEKSMERIEKSVSKKLDQIFGKLSPAIQKDFDKLTMFNLVNNNNNNQFNQFNQFSSIRDAIDPNRDFLTDEHIHCLIKKNIMAMPELVDEVHFDPDHPENHNMYVSNIKTKTAQVKENGRWVTRDAREFVKNIICVHDYQFFYELSKDNQNVEKDYNKYYNITENEKNKIRIENMIIETMYNNREMVIETRKKEEALMKIKQLGMVQKSLQDMTKKNIEDMSLKTDDLLNTMKRKKKTKEMIQKEKPPKEKPKKKMPVKIQRKPPKPKKEINNEDGILDEERTASSDDSEKFIVEFEGDSDSDSGYGSDIINNID
jgi:hypothetical protein